MGVHSPSAPVLQVHAVTLLRQEKPVLQGVSLTVPFGSHMALVGPNGSGKTSLLQLMAGRLRPSQGQVTVGGKTWRPRAAGGHRHGQCRGTVVMYTLFKQEEVT